MARTDLRTKLGTIPEPTLRRLPIYHHLLQTMRAAGLKQVSTTGIAGPLELDPTQVRKDLEATGMAGKPKVGYGLPELISHIEEFLGWDQTREAVLVGAGSLGTALLGYGRFRQLGFHLVAAFDQDPEKVGMTIAGTEVLPLDCLVPYCRRKAVRLGLITTPPEAARSAASALIEGGIRAIWNFAPVHLQVPQSVLLQNEDLYRSLASLSFRLERMLAAEPDSLATGPFAGPEPAD
jgi:redox-sensing transcriptional repressor